MSGFLGALVGGISNFLGASTAASGAADAAKITGKYNLQATQQVIDANEKARAEMRAAATRGLGYIDTGTGQYADTIRPLMTPNPILLPTYRNLTPGQRIGQEDLNRNIQATLASSGLRGAGRAGVAAGIDQNRRYIAAAHDQNDADARGEIRRAQGVADTARSGLAGVYSGAGTNKANTEIGVGTQIGNNLASTGSAIAGLTAASGAAAAGARNAAGQYFGNATLATGNLAGQGLGSVFANGASPNAGGGSGGGGGDGGLATASQVPWGLDDANYV